MATYKKYSSKFKQEVLAMVREGQRNISQLEQELDITPGLIYKWQRQYFQHNENPAQTLEAVRLETKRLERELEIARKERDALKTALQVLSRGS